jgi:hypothetical protein
MLRGVSLGVAGLVAYMFATIWIAPGTPGRQVFPVTREWKVDSSSVAFMGDPAAPFAMLVLSNLECLSCQRFAETVLPLLRSEYVEPGTLQLLLEYVDDESPSLWKSALLSCLPPDEVWPEFIAFGKQHVLTKRQALQLLPTRGRSTTGAAEPCREQVASGSVGTVASGQVRPPTFVIGILDGSGFLRERAFLYGAAPMDAFRRAISAVQPKQLATVLAR